MSIWIIIAFLTTIWGLASLPRDIRDENTLQITLDVALIVEDIAKDYSDQLVQK